jgi:hypothetical protein
MRINKKEKEKKKKLVLPLRSKYFPDHPVLRHSQSAFFPYDESKDFAPV